MKYYNNLTHDLQIILSEDKTLKKNELFTEVKKHFYKNCSVISFERKNSLQYELKINYNEIIYKYYVILKNITNAGWEDKPMIKRVQVVNIARDENNAEVVKEEKSYTIILGYYNYDDNPIFAAWDAYRYLSHKTVRSCYVTVNVLQSTYPKGYCEAVCMKQKVWIFTPENIGLFLINYAKYVDKYYNEVKYEKN